MRLNYRINREEFERLAFESKESNEKQRQSTPEPLARKEIGSAVSWSASGLQSDDSD